MLRQGDQRLIRFAVLDSDKIRSSSHSEDYAILAVVPRVGHAVLRGWVYLYCDPLALFVSLKALVYGRPVPSSYPKGLPGLAPGSPRSSCHDISPCVLYRIGKTVL